LREARTTAIRESLALRKRSQGHSLRMRAVLNGARSALMIDALGAFARGRRAVTRSRPL
jgi:hypothetical protein